MSLKEGCDDLRNDLNCLDSYARVRKPENELWQQAHTVQSPCIPAVTSSKKRKVSQFIIIERTATGRFIPTVYFHRIYSSLLWATEQLKNRSISTVQFNAA